LSPNRRWDLYNSTFDSVLRQGEYVEFPTLPDADVETYLRKADPHRSIRSSMGGIQSSVLESEAKANATFDEVKKEIDKFKFYYSIATFLGTLGIVVPIIALAFQAFSLIKEKDDLIQQSNNKIKGYENKITTFEAKITTMQKQINDLQRKK
jgi:hypothetical protein